ncbi:MAG TPA: prepilin-type N-terminal cleavage/methylation domain-containing protein, partial [bacterium]
MDERGFSLMEVLIASVLAAVVAAGTLASFVASARITGNYNASTMAEAGGISMQIVEKFRDNV